MSVEGFLFICAIICIISIIVFIRNVSIPKVTSSKNIEGLKSIPQNFSYPYYLDNTGIAFDIENKNIYLIDHKKVKTYNVKEIRKFYYSYSNGPEYNGGDLHDFAENLKDKKNAYNNSGLFINVADIDQPQWQIKFSNKKLLLRYFEILNQFREGILPPQKNTPPSE